MINSGFRTGKNYYPQVFLEEYKYAVKDKKTPKYVIDDVSDSDRENSDGESSDEENWKNTN